MKAIAIDTYGGCEVVKFVDLPKPEPGTGEILVRVKAAGVNPVDTKVRKGLLKTRMPNVFPIILGWDAAGVVEKTGPGATKFKRGDAVYAYCRKPVLQHGTYAEYVVIPETFACPKPKSFSFEEAASVPLAALTAYQSLIDAAGLKKVQTVLIHACAGGVGGFGVQIARNTGAHVIGTASAKNHSYACGLGANEVIDYTRVDFCDALRKTHPDGVDVVFDTVGGDVQVRSADALRKGGILVSLLAYSNEAELQKKGIVTKYVFVSPNADQLAVLARWADEGKFKSHLAAVLPLEEAAKAHEMIETGHTVGKIVLKIG